MTSLRPHYDLLPAGARFSGFMWPFAETWSQVAQAFLPGSRQAGTQQARALMSKLLLCGLVVGLASAASSAAVLGLAPQLFTRDASVIATIRSLTPLVTGCIGTVGVMCSMEGSLLATRRFRFLSAFYTANAVALVLAFKSVEFLGLGLRAAWSCMLVFSIVRVGAFGMALKRERPG